MQIQTNVNLTAFNTLGLPAVAGACATIASEADLREILAHPQYGRAGKMILGGGSNVVLPPSIGPVVLKMAVPGRRLVREDAQAWIIEAGAGEDWHDLVTWTLANHWPGLENLALIPGTVGAAPVQNIGAYGVELKDRFDSLDAFDLETGRTHVFCADQCDFEYRHSRFKQDNGRWAITRVRLRLPKPWRPELDYPDLRQRQAQAGGLPNPQQVFEWICALRQAKLPDPKLLGNAGSFFKNPVVSCAAWAGLVERHPGIAAHQLSDGHFKLSAGWLIEACGWKGKTHGNVGIYDKQALVLVNRGGAQRDDVLALAQAIQHSVRERFAIQLEIEPVVVG